MKSNDIIKNLNLIKDEVLIIGASAGPDSMALLHMIKNNTNKKLVCAHINHNVRSISDEEEQYIKKYCQDNNIIFESTKVLTYKEKNFENEARKLRYAFFEKILKKYHSHTLLLAHHGDDLIETILMKIIRGSNLEGYAGIKTYSKKKNYTIIRPLLTETKDNLIKYDIDNKLKFYEDITNNDTKYTRNRIRKNILPLLKQEDKNIHIKFLNYSETLQEYYNYIEEITIEKIKQMYKDNKLNLTIFNKEKYFIKKNIIYYILTQVYNNETNIIKNKQIEEIIDIASSNKPNQKLNLPQNKVIKKEYDYLIITNKNELEKDYKIIFKDKFKINNLVIEKINKTIDNGNNICKLDFKKIKLPLYIRNRKNGDYIEVLGLNGHKKIKDIFIEKKIPLDKRDSYPLLVDANDNILWIPNIKKSKYNAKNNENYDIIINSYEEGEENNETKEKN